MRYNWSSLLLAACLASACAPSHVTTTPTPVAGSRIRYAPRPDSGALIAARVVSLDADSLVFESFVRTPAGDAGAWRRGSLPTDSIARMQVLAGRRRHVGIGALIGGVTGAAAGIACANEEPGWLTPTPTECMVGLTLGGAAWGALIGALIRSDVWAPAVLPARREANPVAPGVSAPSLNIGLRAAIRLPVH